MHKKLSKYIEQHRLIDQGEHVLIAASAGADSTVLCYLFKDLKINFGIAHCNYKLRGKASDNDELFLKKLALEFKVPFFSKSFELVAFSKKNKLGIQEAARKLRYDWLGKIAQKNNFRKIATAHHLDDNIETVLYNFSKSTGIKGVRGILPKKSNLIRPLLFASKKEILEFAKNENIEFREDQSNSTDKYTRNIIRHKITPVFESINPAFQKSAGETIDHLRDVEHLFNFAVQHIQNDIISTKKNDEGKILVLKIDIKKLLASPAPSTVLFEILHKYDFNKSQVRQIIKSIANGPGRFFYSPKKRLLVDREYLIVEKVHETHHFYQIEKKQNESTVDVPGGQFNLRQKKGPINSFPANKNIAYFDADKIEWPLTIRHWMNGDHFQPMGMHGRRKKLQDFFTNLKLSRSEKEKTWIMESGGNICWIVGHRLDERFKVSAKTVLCLVVEFLPGNFVL